MSWTPVQSAVGFANGTLKDNYFRFLRCSSISSQYAEKQISSYVKRKFWSAPGGQTRSLGSFPAAVLLTHRFASRVRPFGVCERSKVTLQRPQPCLGDIYNSVSLEERLHKAF